jgi:hypothetical protein
MICIEFSRIRIMQQVVQLTVLHSIGGVLRNVPFATT